MNRGEDIKPFESPGEALEALEHYGVKGMRWGVRKKEETTERVELKPPLPSVAAKARARKPPLTPDSPEFQQRLGRVTRTDHPQVLRRREGTVTGPLGGKPTPKKEDYTPRSQVEKKKGLTRNQKIALTFGAATAAAAGYYAYQYYTGNKLPDFDPVKIKQQEETLAGLKLPAKWDVSGLKHGPLSTQRLGDLAGGDFNLKLRDEASLVVNTSRGYADILPKDGLGMPFAREQHASVTRVLEEMRNKYPAVRNMNIEVIPMSRVPGLEKSGAHMSVMTMRAGEARIMYNDTMLAPGAEVIRANSRFLPGLGKKDYVAYHEMGHLLAAAHGELPPAFDLISSNASVSLSRKWVKADPLLHKKTFAKHGFTFKELSKLSQYAATEPAEAMAELAGHYFSPEMRSRLTPDQLTRAEAMFNEMGGLTE